MHDELLPLRQAMVEQLWLLDGIRSEPVAAAFAAVPRHMFAPGTPLEEVYDATKTAVWPKRDETGRLISTVSAAHIQAVQVEQADIRPGMRVLEIGSGGYNAALLASLVGSAGEVTTVDIDPEIINRSRGCLEATGFGHVRTLVADGDSGVPQHGPYDRILVTVRSWDIPPGWISQLVPGGRLVVPLRLGCATRTVALDRTSGLGARLRGGDARLCSFVPMQGAGAHEDHIGLLPAVATGGEDGPGRIQLRADVHTDDVRLTSQMMAIAAAVTGSGRHEPVTVWTGVEFDHVDDLDLWLGLRLPASGILFADREITDTSGPTSITRAGAPALVTDGGFAYRTKRPIPGTSRFETGVLAWGSDAAALADCYAQTVTDWGQYRTAGGIGPQLDVLPAGTPIEPKSDHRVLDKIHTRIVVSWPPVQEPRLA